MRIAMLLLVLLPVRAAHAGADVEGFVGLELGPSGAMTGALGERAQLGFGGNVRFGMRVDRLGIEVRMGGRGAELAATDMPAPSYPSLTAMRMGLSYYLLLAGPFQLLGHAELGYGAIGGTRSTQVRCPVEDECPGGVRTDDETVTYGGYGLYAGATVQIHLGRRKHQHAMLWATAALGALRYRFDDDVASGRTREYAFGVACAF